MNLYFKLELRQRLFLTAPHLNFSITCVNSKRCDPNGKLNNLSSGFLFSDHANFGDFTLLFCTGQLKMNTVLNARAELLF